MWTVQLVRGGGGGLVSSTYCDDLAFSFWFGVGYPAILSLFLVLGLIASLFVVWGALVLLLWVGAVVGIVGGVSVSGYPNFRIVWNKGSWSVLSKIS